MSGIGLPFLAVVVLLGCGAIAFLQSSSRRGFGIDESRAQAIYGFAALIAGLATVVVGYRAYRELSATGSRLILEDDWPLALVGLLFAAAVFAAACFVGTLVQVLYHTGCEAPRARREQQRLQEARRRQDTDLAERRAAEAKRTRTSIVKRERRLFDLELIYNYCEPRIVERFSEADFERFVSKYLRGDVSDEEFFERADQLQATIEQYAKEAEPAEQKMSLEEATAWYIERKAQIARLPIDEMSKDDFVLQLSERYAELCQQLMTGVRTT